MIANELLEIVEQMRNADRLAASGTGDIARGYVHDWAHRLAALAASYDTFSNPGVESSQIVALSTKGQKPAGALGEAGSSKPTETPTVEASHWRQAIMEKHDDVCDDACIEGPELDWIETRAAELAATAVEK